MNPAAVLQILVTANTSQATASLAKTDAQLKKTAATANTASGAVGGKLASAAKVGGAALAGGLVYGLYKSVKVGAEFEKQMDSLAAVTGSTTKQMKGLERQALKLGQKTAYSASEAAAAQIELAKGGLAVKDILGGALPAALSLAAAGELELADAAETTVNAMKLFELGGRDASKVADMLATAANTTTADVSDFAMALRQGGSAAKQAGLDLNETVTILEALAEAGIKNSDAGTSMKAAILQLLAPTDKQRKLAEQLNLSFVDQQGNMRSAAAIAGMLRDRLGEYGNAQRTAYLKTLAGTDGFRTLAALYDAGADKLNKLSRANQEQGTAQEIAAKKMDNTAGSIEQLSGALETLGIRVFGVIGPAFRSTVDAATVAVTKFTDFLFGKDARKTFSDFGDAFRALGRGIKGVVEDVILPVVRLLGPGILRSLEGVKQMLKGFVNFIAGVLTLDLGRAWDGIKDIFGGLGGYFLGVLKGAVALVGAPVKALARALTGPIRAAVNGLKTAVVFAFDKILGAVSTALGAVADAAGAFDWLPGVGGKLGALAAGARKAQDSIDGFRESIRGNGAENAKAEALANVERGFDALGHVAGVNEKRLDRAMAGMRGSLSRAIDKFKDFTDSSDKAMDKVGDGTREMGKRGSRNLDGLRRVLDNLSGAWGKGLDIIGRNTSSLLKGLKVGEIAYSIKKGNSSPIDKGANFFQRGGPINLGAPSGDTVPAMLERGEYVLNRNAVAAIGTQNLDALNFRGAPRFQTGGMAGLQPGIARLAKYANERLGLQVSSGLRPGDSDSWHGKGMAVDLVPPGMSATRNLFSTFKNQLEELFYDPWGGYDSGQMIGPIGGHMDHIHAAIVGSGSPAQVGSSRVKRVLLKGPKGPLRDAGQAALDKARSAANAFIRKNSMHGNLGSGGGALSPGEFLALAKRALFITDRSSVWGGSDGFSASGLLALAKQESSLVPSSINNWDINAQQGNPSGGLMHLTQSNMKAYAEPSLSSNMFDPLSSIAASINYQIDRYGGQVTHSPYQVGGLVNYLRKGGKPKKGGPQLNIEGPAWFHPDPSKVRISEPFKTAKKVREQIGLIEHLDERIDLAGRLADLDGEFSEGERRQAIHLNTDLLRKLNKVRSGSEYVLDKTGRQLERKNVPGWQKKLLRPLLTEFGDTLRDVSGVTGKGGRIFDTMLTLAELGKRPETVDPEPTAPLRISELVRFAEAARLAGIGNFAGTFAKGGSIPRGQWGITGERGPEIVHGPATVTPVGPAVAPHIEINFADGMEWLGQFVEVKVDGKLQKRDRSALNEHRAGVTV